MINKHLTYEEWFNEYKDYKDAYKNYVKLQSENDDLKYENQQLKKQKDDAIKFLKSIEMDKTDKYIPLRDYKEFGILLRMLGEIDE